MNGLPEHFFISDCDGGLYDTRKEGWAARPALRSNYKQTRRSIKTTADLKATLRAGEYAWPGGYQMYFVTKQGYAMSFAGVREHLATMLADIKEGGPCDPIVAVDINYEDTDLYCVLTDKPIPASYGE